MRLIWKILPVFVAQWLARKICESVTIGKMGDWHIAWDDILIKSK